MLLVSFVVGFMNKAEEEWWLSECEKLSEVSESQKWKLINKLTNQSSTTVQPILKICNGTQEYLFTDDDICRELEDYHISISIVTGSVSVPWLSKLLTSAKFLFDSKHIIH